MNSATQTRPDSPKADLIQVDHALESWRESGFDLSTAIGELVDNSIEARAHEIRIESFEVRAEEKRKSKRRESIEAIAAGDDGIGIAPEILPHTLTMGFSTSYNQRNGLGRFGVGAKLAALSQGKRVDVYTLPVGSSQIYHTYFDLDEIVTGEQKYLEAELVDTFPAKYRHLMCNDDGTVFESGTLVIWSKVDRLEEGGPFGISVGEQIAKLLKFLARTYREFIARGLKIVFNKQTLSLYDPLFLLPNPRAVELLGDQWQAQIIEQGQISIDGQEVTITVTLLPEQVRLKRGEGGNRGSVFRFKDLRIDENEGRVSILRQKREIYYDIIPRLLPEGKQNQDRFIGIQVAFPATLDEYFRVRHFKRGAEPVDKLREAIKKFLAKPVRQARQEIDKRWAATNAQEQAADEAHTSAIEAMKKVEESAPRGIGGSDITPEREETILTDAAVDLAKERGINVEDMEPDQRIEKLDQLKKEIKEETLTVIDSEWPGYELFEISHLNGRVILKLNWRHPFMRDIYGPIKDLADGKMIDRTLPALEALGQRVQGAIDVLLFSYAKAENMNRHPDQQYGSLRMYWSQLLVEGVRELLRAE